MKITGHGTPVPCTEREQTDTPTMLRVSVADQRVVEDHRIKPKQATGGDGMAKHSGRRSGLTNERVAELLTQGKTQLEIAREYGITSGAVAGHVRRAVKAGRIVSVGYGRYARPEDAQAQEVEQVTKDVDRQAQQRAEGITEERVREIVSEVVAEFKKELEGGIKSLRLMVMDLKERRERDVHCMHEIDQRVVQLGNALDQHLTANEAAADLEELRKQLHEGLAQIKAYTDRAVKGIERSIDETQAALIDVQRDQPDALRIIDRVTRLAERSGALTTVTAGSVGYGVGSGQRRVCDE